MNQRLQALNPFLGLGPEASPERVLGLNHSLALQASYPINGISYKLMQHVRRIKDVAVPDYIHECWMWRT